MFFFFFNSVFTVHATSPSPALADNQLCLFLSSPPSPSPSPSSSPFSSLPFPFPADHSGLSPTCLCRHTRYSHSPLSRLCEKPRTHHLFLPYPNPTLSPPPSSLPFSLFIPQHTHTHTQTLPPFIYICPRPTTPSLSPCLCLSVYIYKYKHAYILIYMAPFRLDLSGRIYPEPINHFDRIPDSLMLLVFNKIGDVKALGSCCVLSRHFHSLVPQVENVVVRVDCVLSDDESSLSSSSASASATASDKSRNPISPLFFALSSLASSSPFNRSPNFFNSPNVPVIPLMTMI